MRKTALAIFGYNRPNHIDRLLKSLESCPEIKNLQIYIFCDGPKNISEKILVEEVIAISKKFATQFRCQVRLSTFNKGLSNSIISGVSEILKTHEAVIVLEDDLLVRSNFLSEMIRALGVCISDPTILSVSAFQPISLNRLSQLRVNSSLTSLRPHSWGWATTADKWNKIDWSDWALLGRLKKGRTRRALLSGGLDLLNMAFSHLNGEIDSWAIKFAAYGADNCLMTMYPIKSLIINAGHDGSGTHSGAIPRESFEILEKFTKFESKNFNDEIFLHYSLNLRPKPRRWIFGSHFFQ